MKLDIYTADKYSEAVQNYQLADATHTDRPQSIIAKSQTDRERFPIVILDDADMLVGFFCLHLGQGPAAYGFDGKKFALIRGFSIDDRFRRQGYASDSLKDLFSFIHSHVSEQVAQVVLAVNENNVPAQKAYQRAGFVKLPQIFGGRLGKLFIFEKSLRKDDIRKRNYERTS